MLSLYLSVATRAFRRYSTYTAATLAGIFTNCVFGVIICYVYLALWEQQPDAGGYDAIDAVTYVWLGQAMIMTVDGVGRRRDHRPGRPDPHRRRRLDLYRPVPLIGWYVAQDLGRSAYHLLARGVAPTLVGALLFDIRFPGSAGGLAGLRREPAAGGAGQLRRSASWSPARPSGCSTRPGRNAWPSCWRSFFSGLTVPLVIFPGWTRDVVMALPWASYLQVPADIWLGKREGWDLLGGPRRFGAGWAAVLLGCCWLVLRRATRKVVVQGG